MPFYIDSISAYFNNLHIPPPLINAYLAAGTEVIGGFLMFIGFGTRLAIVPLISKIIIALLSAHKRTMQLFDDPIKFIALGPLLLLWLVQFF